MTDQNSQSLRREIIDRKVEHVRNLQQIQDNALIQIGIQREVVNGCQFQIDELRASIAQLNGETV